MHEIEYTHLKKNWLERVIASGIDKKDAYKWVAEIGQVVDEYERRLGFLVDLLQESEVEPVAQRLESWFAYTQDMTVWKLEEATKELKGRYEKYLPPEPDDDDDLL